MVPGTIILSLVFDLTYAQLGIGTLNAGARLHIHGGAVLSRTPALDPQNSPFYDPQNSDDEAVMHAFKWVHEKGAFRAMGSGVSGSNFDPVKSGQFSHASGFGTIAEGVGSTALGARTIASGVGAFGNGWYNIAAGNFSFVHGFFSIADGSNCVSIGSNLSNNYQTGAFIFGVSSTYAESTGNHQMQMLFDGGYRFFTNSNMTTEVILAPGANSWSVMSDIRKKENFIPVPGKAFMSKIGNMNLTSWNYKGQNALNERHYGPMAQDFFEAFGHDGYGTIGNDTTINQADLDGVTLAAIQALIRTTDDLEKLNEKLLLEVAELKAKTAHSKRRAFSRRKRVLLTRK
jgi:hypothetical protein